MLFVPIFYWQNHCNKNLVRYMKPPCSALKPPEASLLHTKASWSDWSLDLMHRSAEALWSLFSPPWSLPSSSYKRLKPRWWSPMKPPWSTPKPREASLVHLISDWSLHPMHRRAEALESHLLRVADEAGGRVVPGIGHVRVLGGVDEEVERAWGGVGGGRGEGGGGTCDKL